MRQTFGRPLVGNQSVQHVLVEGPSKRDDEVIELKAKGRMGEASARLVRRVRMQIGYIFQAHNLLDALTATQNVQMALRLHRLGAAS